MPIRRVQQQSDRGSIKDLQNGDDNKYPPTPQELRLKALYEHGLATRDQALIESLGFIAVTSAPKDPVSWYRHKQYIEQLSNKLGPQLQQTQQELASCFAFDVSDEFVKAKIKQKESLSTILQSDEEIIKTASPHLKRSFRRII